MRRLSARLLLCALLAASVTTGCGRSAEPKTVPNVTGVPLDVAEARLDARGVDFIIAGGGTFGVILRSRWQVCEQDPRAGRTATEVTLVVERACSTMPPQRAVVVPDVKYASLDDAEAELRRAGLGYTVVPDGVIVVRSNWQVCNQDPAPGEWGASVELYVERDCWDW